MNDRLLELERQNRRLRILVTAFALVTCIAAALHVVPAMRIAEAETAKSVEAEQFVVRDSRGNGRVFIGVTADGPLFEFRDTRGKTRLSLAMEKDDVLLSVYDSRAMAADSRGRLQARVAATRTGVSVGAYDAGTLAGSVVVKPAKSGTMLVIEDAGGKAVWSAPPPEEGKTK